SLPLTIVILLGQQNFLPSSLYPLWAGTVVICCLSVAFSSVLFVLILRLLVVQRKLDLDLDCKIAVGQELNLLMRQGCSVFHDVPADGSSIDHVLVGPSGVYVIATKGRVKPRRRKGSLEERVFYDGKELVFPGCNDTGPLLQVKWQAAWFAEWLSGVVGEKVLVKGIVFLPGWTVEASGRNEISVVNEDSAHLLAKPRGDNVLGEDSLQRIAYQIEHHCRIMTGEGG
ncbi:MAG: NERD domain-containing protein, partial [Desulfobulbaceae bacterium]|nr:NERD domain-containing protein [Desulfobulbaceae bacterium]